MDATRISDGRPVILKKLPREEGRTNLKSTSFTLLSLLPPISEITAYAYSMSLSVPIILQLLCIRCYVHFPSSDPLLQTYGVFVTFFSHTCEVSLVSTRVNLGSCSTDYHRVSNLCMRTTLPTGMWPYVIIDFNSFPICSSSGTVHAETSCLTRQICSPSLFIPL